ncbi:TRAP transporter substrate-binding protein DctP [Lawsonibacter celer]|uniref:TRAP transporter substrate-binding protein DctP n=1 Tax=Lawsonibacter celer TaxID=2986526 RepID=UPI001646FC70|nr:TRAP transporter substrate-binding protein DctP [Lawsonibacter celer]
MKKKMALLLAGVLSVSMLLSACGNGGQPSGGNTNSPAPSTSSPSGSETQQPAGDPVKITFASYGNSSMPPAMGHYDAIDYISETSGGAIEIDFIPDGVLGGESDVMQQVMDGTVQMVECSASSLNLYTTLSECFQLPFLITDYETEQAALSSDAAQAIYDKIAEDLGLKIIGFSENGLRHFANNTRPITCVDDLKGLKLRIAPSNMLTDAIERLGASPMTVGYNDVYSALQNKVVDGEEINLTSIYALKHYEQLKYVSEIGMYPYPAFVVFNLDFWNSLTDDQRQIITDGFTKGCENVFSTYLPDYEEEARAAIVADNTTAINVIEGDAKQEFVNICTPIWDEYREKDPLIADFIAYVESLS